jgi:basic membrane lipoprotein Med (substrate-binding protein (PBP1-ABC) superfamily)
MGFFKQGSSKAVVAVAAGVVVSAAAVAAWMLWPGPGPGSATAAAPPARQYLDVSACLLTGAGGVSPGTVGGQAWSAMESASLTSHVMVSHLPSAEPADVPVLLNTLIERECGVIVVTGASQNQVTSAARANPGHRFILVAGGTSAGSVAVLPNAVTVSAARAPGRINQEVLALAGAS